MIRISNIKYPIEMPEENIIEFTVRKYRINGITDVRIVKKSIDARKKNDIHYVYTLDISAQGEKKLLKRLKNASEPKYESYVFPDGRLPEKPVVVVGFGPAGMMCSYMLAKNGCKVIVLERGKAVDERMKDVAAMRESGILDPESNVQFGEGGAGTFSDGKLTTGTNDRRIGCVLEEFASHGAPGDILYKAKPHVGTDKLVGMVKSFRKSIEKSGGEVRFSSRLDGIKTENGRVAGAVVHCGGETYTIETDHIVLAAGHSARDTFLMLKELGVKMERKVFAVGARIEHRQEDISRSQYGEMYKMLPAADYKLSVRTPTGRSAYTFCMCPGGTVVASASEPGGVVTNGMSEYARDGENANSALLVNVMPEDIPGDDVLGGIEFQRKIERRAYDIAGGYFAPAQTVGDFLHGNGAEPTVEPTYRPGVRFCSLDDILPPFVTETMREALPLLDKKLHGFAADGAVLTAPETRSSSPVRILRDETGQASIKGLYPCGEGAGYAGGIMTAAVDGIKTAEKIVLENRK